MDAAEEERLEAALQVVQAIMQHEVSALLFNIPVDPVKLGIPDYFRVIKQPMVRMAAPSVSTARSRTLASRKPCPDRVPFGIQWLRAASGIGHLKSIGGLVAAHFDRRASHV